MMKRFDATDYQRRVKEIVEEYREALLNRAENNDIKEDDLIEIETGNNTKTCTLQEELDEIADYSNEYDY